MVQKRQTQPLPLWQPVRVEQVIGADCFAIDVTADDTELGSFIAAGCMDVSVLASSPRGKKVHQFLERLGASTLEWRLAKVLRDIGSHTADSEIDTFCVHCRQVVSMPGGARIGLLCSLTPAPDGTPCLPVELLAEVQAAVAIHQANLSKHAIDVVMKTAEAARRLEPMSPEQRKALEDLQSKFPLDPTLPPPLDLKPLVVKFPIGLVVKLRSTDPDAVERSCERGIRQQPDEQNPPPRDGWYQSVVATANRKQVSAFITWQPHRGLPPYPEIRAALERRLSRAFSKPRQSGIQPPHIGGGLAGGELRDARPLVFDSFDLDWLEDEDFNFGFDSPRDVAGEVKGRLRELGFEAIGWYQSHHCYNADSWGIYIDARKLDELACSIAEDLLVGGLYRGRNALAAKLALMLVYRHELFHAKVEAALSWLELQALQPKFNPYLFNVYDTLKGTDGHLEEALANWSAWAWISLDSVVAQLSGQRTADERRLIERIIKGHLDLSPPGYRRWNEGREPGVWRTLATQMAQGQPRLTSPGIGLPIEPMLREGLPFDFDEQQDVPCRFVGQGRIAASMFSAPATLNVPTRHEVRRVLQRHFCYDLVPGAGKGSHEKFRHANGRMFPLPRRDPLSMTVFKSFLGHFELSKSEYDEIRRRV